MADADPSRTADTTSPPVKSMDAIVALCRRRGFIWQSSEIYGGINGFWDYGPLGARLKKNLKDAWWHDIVDCPPDGPDGHPLQIVPVDTTIIMHPKVWEASGHVAGFSDPMVDCKKTQKRYRADKVWVVGFNHPESARSRMEETAGVLGTMPDLSILERMLSGEATPDEQKRFADSFHKAQEALAARASMAPHAETFDLMIAVEGDSPEEAVRLASASLNRKQRKVVNAELLEQLAQEIRNNPTDKDLKWFSTFCVRAHNQTDLPPHWPALSPATQEPTLTAPREFNLMYDVYNGAVRDESNKSWLRPETAQGIFTQFWNVVDTSRVKVPFGIAQQGKAFRNEVTPRNFTFRSREFEQMEVEFFIRPDDHRGKDEPSTLDWYRYWRDLRYAWWQSVGLAGDNLTLREHDPDELAHYAKEGAGTSDVEYRFPFTAPGFGELEGIAHRSDYDLRQHAEHSGYGDKKRYFDQEQNARYFPHVIEPSAGADRGTLALLCEAYTPDESRPSKVFMKFTPRMAPIKAGVFPLVNKDGMPEIAEDLYRRLRTRWACEFDVKQSIGKRYARMDEAGTPYCFTVDGDTLKDQTVTVRDRDTAEQTRIALDQVEAFLAEKIGG